MFKDKKIVAIVPAREGSKRIKHKNAALINGKYLFEYSIDVAMESKYIDKVIFSTDSEEWLSYAHKLGCEKNNIRPEYLANDTARTVDVILYELENLNLLDYDAVILLQPTSPYRTVELLDSAIEEYFKTETSLITIVEAEEQPLFMRKIVNGRLEKIIDASSDLRSQDFSKIYKIIGNIYINNIKTLNKNTVLNENEIGFIIDDKFNIDIDEMEDLDYARSVMENLNNNKKSIEKE